MTGAPGGYSVPSWEVNRSGTSTATPCRARTLTTSGAAAANLTSSRTLGSGATAVSVIERTRYLSVGDSYNTSCAGRFIAEFNDDVVAMYGLPSEMCVAQRLDFDYDAMTVRLYARLYTPTGPREVSVADAPCLSVFDGTDYLGWVMDNLKLSDAVATARLRICGLILDD